MIPIHYKKWNTKRVPKSNLLSLGLKGAVWQFRTLCKRSFHHSYKRLHSNFQNNIFSKKSAPKANSSVPLLQRYIDIPVVTLVIWLQRIWQSYFCFFRKRQHSLQLHSTSKRLMRTRKRTDSLFDETWVFLKFSSIVLENCWLQIRVYYTVSIADLSHGMCKTQKDSLPA